MSGHTKRILLWIFGGLVLSLTPLWISLFSFWATNNKLFPIFYINNGGLYVFTIVISVSSLGSYYSNLDYTKIKDGFVFLVIPFIILMIFMLLPSGVFYYWCMSANILGTGLNKSAIFVSSIIFSSLSTLFGISLFVMEKRIVANKKEK